MLRSIIGSHPNVAFFPREINYIWRHGNIRLPTDELQPEHAQPEIRHYIRKRFHHYRRRNNCARILEKTCANSLRVDFVRSVFREATFIHLVRDGRAVAESALRRWLAKPDLNYLMTKARWVPLQDFPYYGLRFLIFQINRFRSKTGTPASWGPIFAGLDELVRQKPLIHVCGLQWKACVEAADNALSRLPAARALSVRYEDLVQDPLQVSAQLFEHLGLTFPDSSQRFIRHFVTTMNLGKWRSRLSEEVMQCLLPQIEPTLQHFGYIC